MARKTIEVETVRKTVNRALNTEADGNTPDYRRALCSVLEDVLMKTGNYKGFRYSNLTPVMKDAEGYLLLGQPDDDTRRVYY